MIYEKKDDLCVLELVHGFNDYNQLKIVSKIVTDGEYKMIDDDYYESLNKVIPMLNKDSSLQKNLNNVTVNKTKKVLIQNYNYISIIYYILINDKWCVYKTKHMINSKYNIFDEIKFLKYHQVNEIIGRYVTKMFPLEVEYKKIDVHLENKVLIKR